MNEVIIKVIGNYSYQTSRCLGEGVYGKVYEGMERESKEKVAIKKIDLATFTNDKYLENAIFSEIYLLKRFNHPNIVRFKDVLSSKNSLYIITEFCKNGDLKELIKRKRFKEEEAFDIMRQILSGFTQLVREKIIHRDLKPANILINEGVYKIGDFGFAKYVDNFGSQMLKSCVGSPIYMAPQILQRTQYTTKCDIWSLGIIFYEMIHGCPPWKARDEPQLLRGIKNYSISHVLKRSSLTSKGNEFLKKTLAYSEEERISWSELFQQFCPKPEKLIQLTENKYNQSSNTKEKQKNRVLSTNSTSNLSSWNSNNIVNPRTNLTPLNSGNGISRTNSKSNLNSYSPEKRRNLFSATEKQPEKRTHTYQNSNQLETLKLWRQFCIYYHFYCVELILNFHYIGNITNRTELYAKLLLSLGLLVKNKSTFCLTLISVHAKYLFPLTRSHNKSVEELQKKMQSEHESYEQAYNDITSILERANLYKSIRSEISTNVVHGQTINEDRLDKLQSFMLNIVHQNAQILSDEVRKRAKTLKELTLAETLDYMMDLLALGFGKEKTLKEMSEDSRNEEEDLKDYVNKVIAKVDKVTSNI